ncbi:MAG: hypothetical protein V1899_07355 [Planctomycetota bacterium]
MIALNSSKLRWWLMVFGCGILLLVGQGFTQAGEDAPKDPLPIDPAKDAVALAESAKKAEAARNTEVWQKLETKPVPLNDPRQIRSPGLYDQSMQNVITFPKDGSAVDLGLPHFGKNASGKEYPALLAKFNQDFIWVDLNGDGKSSADEIRGIRPDGICDPFTCELHYQDGSASSYRFCFKTVVEKEKFAIIRSMGRTATFEKHKLMLFDDNGNGKYNDDIDALLIDDNPMAFLGRYILLNDQFYELVAHEAGTVIEIRPAAQIEHGFVDLYKDYTPSQKGENLKLHTIIIRGTNGSFAGDENHKMLKVPVGAYDLSFGLLERAKEVVYVKKGEKTSFNVIAKTVAAPKWGGKITAKFDVTTDGYESIVNPPCFVGQNTEIYFPENFHVTPVTATIAQVLVDTTLRFERIRIFNQSAYKMQPDGDLKAIVFKPCRLANDTYEITVACNSGIMGKVFGVDRLQFIYRKEVKDQYNKNKNAKGKGE